MLSYRHNFHAGNHADILKHTARSLIIEALKEKGKPSLYLDAHVGAGRYQSSGERAKRTDKYLEGIARIWQQGDLPAELELYISVVEYFNRNGQLRYYPGSPLVARQLLCEQDNLQMTGLYPSSFPLLHAEFRKDGRAHVDEADGYQQLKARLPPVPCRGLIPIGPPHETKTDYQAVITGIHEGYKCFATGTYVLWYPVMLHTQIKHMIKELEATGIRKILQIELAVRPDSDQRGMTASGMIIINPSWKLEQQMSSMPSWLHSKLVPAGIGHATVSWIVPE